MESKCSWNDAPWSGGSGSKCLGNYLDHLMLLRVALTAGEPATTAVVERNVRNSALAAPGQCALWRPQLQQQPQPARLLSTPPEQQPQRRPQPQSDRSPPLRRTHRRESAASAEEQRPAPKECAARRSPAAPEASCAAAEENIYFELEPPVAAGQSEPAAASVARLALERLSALAERGLLDVATVAAASPCERDGDARRPATVPRAARPHAAPERRGAGCRRVSSVADALALAGDCERAAAAGCEQLLFDLCSGDSGEHRWQHRQQREQPQQRTHVQPTLGVALATAASAAADHRAELSLLTDEEPVYETIPCDDTEADGDAEFDAVQHSSCSRRRVPARPPQHAVNLEKPPQLPPPRLQQSATPPRSRLASAGESETDSCSGAEVISSTRSTSDDAPVRSAVTVTAAQTEKRPSCSSELQTCRIKMGVAAKKAWDERCVRRPSQTFAPATAPADSAGESAAALAAKCRRNSAAACSATAPSRPAAGLAAPYKALPAVRC